MAILLWIQFGSIRWQPLYKDFSSAAQILTHDFRSVRWRSIPDQNEPTADLPVDMLERLDDQLAIYGTAEVPLVNLAADAQADGA